MPIGISFQLHQLVIKSHIRLKQFRIHFKFGVIFVYKTMIKLIRHIIKRRDVPFCGSNQTLRRLLGKRFKAASVCLNRLMQPTERIRACHNKIIGILNKSAKRIIANKGVTKQAKIRIRSFFRIRICLFQYIIQCFKAQQCSLCGIGGSERRIKTDYMAITSQNISAKAVNG